MDLKSMLNDAGAQRQPPRLHTPHSSYDARAVEHASSTESRPDRPSPYPPPLQPVDARGQSAGGYFGLQSPHQTNLNSASTHASTPSAGTHSAYARSPGPHPQSYSMRDSAGPHSAYNPSSIPSPSMSALQPPTPGSVHQYHNHTPSSAHSQVGPLPPYAYSQSPRASYPPTGPSPTHARQISPNTQHHHPATPLGPPINYNKVSPHAHRSTSQGMEHLRRTSHGSAGSIQSREQVRSSQQPPDLERADTVQRQSLPDLDRVRERDRSVSVSPKTVPQPSPFRQMSTGSQAGSLSRASIQSPMEMSHVGASFPAVDKPPEAQPYTPNSRSSVAPAEQNPPPTTVLTTSHAVPAVQQQSVQQQSLTTPPPPIKKDSPMRSQPPNLKRNASVISDRSSTVELPRKRLRRDDIPIFARSARTKALRLGQGAPRRGPTVTPQVKREPVTNGQSAPRATVTSGSDYPPQVAPVNPDEVKWEPTIENITPMEDLTRYVCDWIYNTIGEAPPPAGGAVFEIEAKIGEIFDLAHGSRLRLPVATETIFDKKLHGGRTKFESSMNMAQHQQLNEYLNELVKQSHTPSPKGPRSEIAFAHPQNIDQFFDLTPEGKQNLDPMIMQYSNSQHAPRVRRTTDSHTRKVTHQIIKTRISDIEIYNPSYSFDIRISISIESPWEGSPSWLVPSSDGKTRHKDRMSYRHLAYQIDLTQVSLDDTTEHELEVEISTEQIRKELDNLRHRRPNRYQDLIKGLVDNVRLLSRKGTLG